MQKIFYPLIEDYSQSGYRVVIADVRGHRGLHFGQRKAEVDREEVADIGELIQWAPASKAGVMVGVATTGTSYSGITTLYSLVTLTTGT